MVDSNVGIGTIFPSSSVRRSRLFTQTTHEAHEELGEPKSSFQVHHCPKKFPNYVALMYSIFVVESSSYKETTSEKVWWDAMIDTIMLLALVFYCPLYWMYVKHIFFKVIEEEVALIRQDVLSCIDGIPMCES